MALANSDRQEGACWRRGPRHRARMIRTVRTEGQFGGFGLRTCAQADGLSLGRGTSRPATEPNGPPHIAAE
eukprot:9313234-Alexandrium_andersonii.AAC.1